MGTTKISKFIPWWTVVQEERKNIHVDWSSSISVEPPCQYRVALKGKRMRSVWNCCRTDSSFLIRGTCHQTWKRTTTQKGVRVVSLWFLCCCSTMSKIFSGSPFERLSAWMKWASAFSFDLLVHASIYQLLLVGFFFCDSPLLDQKKSFPVGAGDFWDEAV